MTDDGAGGQQLPESAEISVDVENVGGIDASSFAFSRGVTVFTGRNATNRTSLLRAVAGALGGTAGVLKRDADSGSVAFTIGGERYARQYRRERGSVRAFGEPYTDDETVVDLFVCLLEDNPVRQAVRAGDDLAELLLAPIDTDELEAKISKLRSERDRIEEQLTEIDRERKRLPRLEERRTELRERLTEVEDELDTVRDRADGVDRERAETDETESILRALEETQNELERTESELGTQRRIREELRTELADVREERSQLAVRRDELAELEQRIERLQGRESELSVAVNELSTILTQNRDVLAGNDAVVTELAVEDDAVSELDPTSKTVECWTCGSRVERRAISDRLEDIERLVEAKREERDRVRDQLSECRSRRDSVREEIQRHDELTEREAELEREIERRAESVGELADEADALRDAVADHRADLEPRADAEESEEFAAVERLSELEYERGRLERELRDVRDDIEEIEYLLGKSDDFEARRADITEQITSLRSRVETLEKATVDAFNTHMEAVLDRLEYENVERVWLERRKAGGETTFALHVVREDDAGSVYEDSVGHLSESEREVVGLVVALAGYLAHDVRETVPVLLLDSLEAIDPARIAALVDYFEAHTDALLLALLPEDASGLSESHDRVHAEERLT